MRAFLIRSCVVSVIGLCLWTFATLNQNTHHVLHQSAIKFSGIYLGSRDPEALATFYQQVLGGKITQTDQGQVLRTPDYSGEGPHLYFLQASTNTHPLKPHENGFAHICVEVEDVPSFARKVVSYGGTILSTFEKPENSVVLYLSDPDGNVLEVHLPFASPVTPVTIWRTLKSAVISYLGIGDGSMDQPRFLHVNVNTDDWKKTAAFYEKGFNTRRIGWLRNYEGSFIEELVGIENITINGAHVALPGYSTGGPTLEVFTYTPPSTDPKKTLQDVGILAMEFEVNNPDSLVKKLVATGATETIAPRTNKKALRDPTGNLILVRKK